MSKTLFQKVEGWGDATPAKNILRIVETESGNIYGQDLNEDWHNGFFFQLLPYSDAWWFLSRYPSRGEEWRWRGEKHEMFWNSDTESGECFNYLHHCRSQLWRLQVS